VGLARMSRTIRERMNIRDNEVFTPQDLINAKTLSSVINSFFGTNQLSQFMDQTNPLAEITHKRRMSALGPGGLSRERAGFEVRDVHYTHYGRLCTIETPEGPNIGLISSLCVHAKINSMGFIETPYLKVENGIVSVGKPVTYLSAEDEEGMVIAQSDAKYDEASGKFIEPKVKARYEGDFPMVEPEKLQFMDIAPNQIVSIAASMIPFLEHNDANRALMGSNMQRQAVPLLRPEAPVVGTGLEGKIARDSRNLLLAEGNGVVEFVDGNEIRVRYEQTESDKLVSFGTDTKTYKLIKFLRTNQNTCINLRPIVKKGEKVTKGKVLCEGYATQGGELAIGRNLKVAFMPWQGNNFEDAIVISERVTKEDIFTSIHITEYELEVRDTKRGEEELTNDIPNVSEDATRNLDENGLIRIGCEVFDGDILIGKITPKGETEPSPEEKLLRAIFGDKAGDVKDASLKASPSTAGVVIEKKLFARLKKDKTGKADDKSKIAKLTEEHDKNISSIKSILVEKLFSILTGKTSQGVMNVYGEELISKGTKFTMKNLGEVDYTNVNANNWSTDSEKNDMIKQILSNYKNRVNQELADFRRKEYAISVGDELPTGILKLAKVYIAQKRKLKVGDKMAGRHGNKGIVARIVRDEDLPFQEDGRPVDIVLNPLGVPSRMNLGQIYETVLGWAGIELGLKFATPIFDGANDDDVLEFTRKAGIPDWGKTYLYDGLSGERFDQPTTVGVIYMIKLGHMVDDKMHARSIGPYSLITQQPLGGKAQFGGQRFGEMEVWALEAYGASNILQEILTVKSDDIIGRAKAYESIVKGDNMPQPGIPESFNVLLHELRGLGLDVTLE
jgi:DNA-directed RNA polymerase subunit beta